MITQRGEGSILIVHTFTTWLLTRRVDENQLNGTNPTRISSKKQTTEGFRGPLGYCIYNSIKDLKIDTAID